MNTRWRIAQHFEQYWWRRYLHGKDWPRYRQWKCAYWNSLLKHVNTITPSIKQILAAAPQHILDAGCGPAGIYLVLEEHQVTAVDPLINTYTYWLEHFKAAAFPWVDFRNLPLEQFRTREPFSLVFCLNALNHVADIETATHRLVAATQPDGYVVMTLDVHKYPILKTLFRILQGDILHPHQYTLQGYVELFNSHGLALQGNQTIRNGRLFDHELLVFKKI